MTDRPVINFESERLIREGEAAAKQYKKRSGEIRMIIYPMVRGLFAARATYSSDTIFGKWLEKSEYAEIGQTDRAALIELGRYPSDALLQHLGNTTSNSPRIILQELRDSKFGSHMGNAERPALAPKAKKAPHPNQDDLFDTPARFLCENFELEHGGKRYHVSCGSAGNAPIEISVMPAQIDESVRKLIADDVILINLAMRNGALLTTLRDAITRNPDGSPASVVGAILDKLCLDA
jgi:hypothetical protein